jgi:hypothetical protein
MHEQVITDLANVSEYIAEQMGRNRKGESLAKMLTELQVKKLLIISANFKTFIYTLHIGPKTC